MTTFRKEPTKIPITAAIGMANSKGIAVASSEMCSEPISCIQVRWYGRTVVTRELRVKRGKREGHGNPSIRLVGAWIFRTPRRRSRLSVRLRHDLVPPKLCRRRTSST